MDKSDLIDLINVTLEEGVLLCEEERRSLIENLIHRIQQAGYSPLEFSEYLNGNYVEGNCSRV